VFKTKPIQKKNRKPNQSKPKPQKTAFGSDVFKSFFYSTAWFSPVSGFDYQPNQTKPNRNIRKTLIRYISSRSILIEIQWKL